MTGLHAALTALVGKEMAEAADRGARSERADVRCPGCGLRYDERQQYGCGEPGHGHSYDEDELAEAAERGRQVDLDCVSVLVAELRALLASQQHALGRPQRERPARMPGDRQAHPQRHPGQRSRRGRVGRCRR